MTESGVFHPLRDMCWWPHRRKPERSRNGTDRNLLYHHYGGCFNHAIEKRWPDFSCSVWEYRAVKAAPEDAIDGYFLLRGEIFRQEREGSPALSAVCLKEIEA